MFNTLSTKEFYKEKNSLSLEDFLLWFKGKIEAEWVSLTDVEVEKLERKWEIHFPLAYRKLLTILGFGQYTNFASSVFYNWREDQEGIAKALAWPLEGLLFDVENNGLWCGNWGSRPGSVDDRRKKLTELVATAPPLIPVMGHRYMLDCLIESQNPVLSVYQSDIIVYGMNLQRYLLSEFDYLLNLNADRAGKNAVQGWSEVLIASIPFWGDIIVGNYGWEDEPEA